MSGNELTRRFQLSRFERSRSIVSFTALIKKAEVLLSPIAFACAIIISWSSGRTRKRTHAKKQLSANTRICGFPESFHSRKAKNTVFCFRGFCERTAFFYFGICENAGGHVKQRALTGFRRCRFSQFHTNSTRRGIIVNKSTTRQKQKHRKNKKKVPNLYDSELFPSMYLVEISGIEPLTSWMPFKRSPSWAIPPWARWILPEREQNVKLFF